MSFAPLFDPTNQFMTKAGTPLFGGRLYVYLNGTENLATVKNIEGTTVQQPILTDANGRATGGVFVPDGSLYRLEVRDPYDALLWSIAGMSALVGGSGPVSAPTFVSGGSSGGGSVTKTITLPHKYKNAFGGFISFIVRSSSSGLTRTVNWEYTVAGSGISYEIGSGQTIVVNYETKVTMPFIVYSDTPFNQITIKFNGTSADTSIYDAAVYFYAEEVAEP